MNYTDVSAASSKAKAVINEIEKVIIGKRTSVTMLMVALLAGGHVLIEDVPGVGKTTLATALGKAAGLQFRRAQFTPDVMASDITGFTMYNKETQKFEYRQGLVLTNLLLADEINRTSPKTQSALLEAMEERNVTVDGTTYKLPEPFVVIATQNEVGHVGTFPLPEAQLDRFTIKLSMGYPTVDEELDIITGRRFDDPIKSVTSVCTRDELIALTEAARQINVDIAVGRYIVKFVAQTRYHPWVSLGASPRASLALIRCSQAFALISGRNYVTPEDVIKMVPYVLSHRIHLKQEAKIKGITVSDVIEDISRNVTAPIKRGERI